MFKRFLDRVDFPYFNYISEEGLKNLSRYQYKGIDHSFIANNFLQPYWTWLASKLPDWPAPNLITLVGFIPCIISYLIMSYYCPTLSEEAPRWVYLFNCICLFFYQTMDALDGKQARRTGTSSPLGELFDHGCDALTTIFVALTVAATIRIGNGILLYLAVLSLLIPFYTTQWEEYFTGTLVLGYIGVTEGQVLSMALYLIAYIYGPNIFSNTIPLFGLTFSLTTWIALFCIISGIGQTFWNVSIVLKLVSEKKVNYSNAIRGVIPMILIAIITCLWYSIRPECIRETPHAYHLMIGLVVANFVGRIIVYRVCSLKTPLFIELLVPLTICSSISIISGNVYLSTRNLVYICLLIYFVLYMNFALSIINQMTKHLNIRCLVIPTPNNATKLKEKTL